MQSEYAALVESAKTIEKAKQELTKEEGSFVSPAWTMLYHAQRYIAKLAEVELREERA